jgi:nicotinamide-nucleotide amidase
VSDFAELARSAARLLDTCRRAGLTLATAESCTGGLIAALLTEASGASQVFERGFVTYSNASKSEMLGVEAALIADHGAVSSAVARAMAEGALSRSAADVAVSVTGIAGPDGGTSEKPVGLVHLAAARRNGDILESRMCFGDIGRSGIRLASAEAAFALVLRAL